MVNSPALLEKLNLDSRAVISMYNEASGMWEDEGIDRVFRVISQQNIFIRLKNVTYCPRFEQLRLAEVTPTIVSPTRSVARKRKVSEAFEGSADKSPSPKRPNLDCNSESGFLPAATTIGESNFTPTPTTPSFQIIAAPDSPLCELRWPADLHTCKVAKKFQRIIQAIGSVPIRRLDSAGENRTRAAFKKEFPGYLYVRSSFARHLATWRGASVEAREAALSSPCDVEHLWKAWYSRAPSKPSR